MGQASPGAADKSLDRCAQLAHNRAQFENNLEKRPRVPPARGRWFAHRLSAPRNEFPCAMRAQSRAKLHTRLQSPQAAARQYADTFLLMEAGLLQDIVGQVNEFVVRPLVEVNESELASLREALRAAGLQVVR